MEEMWDRTRNLKGRTLHTIDERKPFEVTDVEDEKLVIRPHDGKSRVMHRDRIEQISKCNIPREVLRKYVQQQFPDTRNASYIAAIADEVRGFLETRSPAVP